MSSFCQDGEWLCRTGFEHPPAGEAFEDWAWQCEVFGCSAQVYLEDPGPDWREEAPYTPPDPGTLTGEWVLVADSDDIIPLGCERRPKQYAAVQSLALNPRNPDVMYVGMDLAVTWGIGSAAGVYKSVDGGRTWFSAWAGLGYASCGWCDYAVTVHDLFVDPDDPSVVFASTDERGLWRSADGGAHWTEVRYPGYGKMYADEVRKGKNGVLYFFAMGQEFFRSTGGVEWESTGLVSQERTIATMVPDPNLPDRIWLGMAPPFVPDSTEGLILVSDDSGATWRDTAHQLLNLSDRASVQGLAICPADPSKMAVALYSWYEGGIFLSEDGGETWRNAGEPIDKDGGLAVAYAPLAGRCVLYASEVDDHSTWWTDDHGQQWHWMGRRVLYDFAFNPFLPEMVFAIISGIDGDPAFELWVRK